LGPTLVRMGVEATLHCAVVAEQETSGSAGPLSPQSLQLSTFSLFPAAFDETSSFHPCAQIGQTQLLVNCCNGHRITDTVSGTLVRLRCSGALLAE